MSNLSPEALPPIIGQAPALLAALEHASAGAQLDRPLLVIGERGTGKELVAARVHFLSPRWDKAYVKVNCAALTESLLESELFGHEAGAFTGAARRHVGRFERADGGTLFLDEIAAASLRVQEQILRVVEYGELERVGGSQTLKVDVRVVAATNVDLPLWAAEGRFRPDLLDRLSFDVVTLPPLRARWEDIPVLADHFGQRMAAELGLSRFAGFSHRAMGLLLDHAWPGNIRELKNVVERAVHRARLADPEARAPIDIGALDPFDSPWRPRAHDARPAIAEPEAADERPFVEQVARLEKKLILQALAAEDGHQGRTADRLGLSYHQLRGLIRKHAITKRRAEGAEEEKTPPTRLHSRSEG